MQVFGLYTSFRVWGTRVENHSKLILRYYSLHVDFTQPLLMLSVVDSCESLWPLVSSTLHVVGQCGFPTSSYYARQHHTLLPLLSASISPTYLSSIDYSTFGRVYHWASREESLRVAGARFLTGQMSIMSPSTKCHQLSPIHQALRKYHVINCHPSTKH